MNIDITKLKNALESTIQVDESIKFPDDEIKKAEMLDLSPVKVNGQIVRDSLDGYNVSLNISGIMVLPCAITLKPVDYPFSIDINENFSETADEISKKIKIFENTIDILPIVWENILMEIPMRVVSPDASLEKVEGDGWRLVTGESKDINPELAKLKDLFK